MLTVVTGPPASGKSTWVRQQAKAGDIVIDFDTLANALTVAEFDNHEHPRHLVNVAKAARTAAIGEALKHSTDVDVYLLHSTPGAEALRRYRRQGARIVTIDPGEHIVRERCKRLRPSAMLPVVDRWYREQGDSHASDHVVSASRRSREW
ncbi:AAA domain-containing protein [Actinopolyspora xinjiangensis]|uniref:AAA domain-containing protein n=2 Tax=Actinopolyspora xinjiangensis TaxID=405564 RepID=A0A1H0U463_9ACTN|nr:AAA domain-containing protein [Actinopolyspora xinjiangensis]